MQGLVVADEVLEAVRMDARDRRGIHLLERPESLYAHLPVLLEFEMSPQCCGVLMVYRSPRSTLESMQGGRCGYWDANSSKLQRFSRDRLERCRLAYSRDEIYAHLPAWRKVPDHRIIAQKIFGLNSIDLWIVSIRRAEGRGNSADVLAARSDQQIHALGGPNDPVHSQCRCPNQFVLDPTSLQSIEHATKLVSIHSAKTSKTSNESPT